MSITGKAIIRVDGLQLATEDNATLNLGGQNRTGKMAGGVHHGYQEEDVPATLECTVIHKKDVSLKDLSNIKNATVLFETDTGYKAVLRDAFATEPAALGVKEGTASLKLESKSADEI